MDKCKIIAIANQKGGVGKTTTTVNLGVGLARAGHRVLLVDGDPQGSLTIALGIPNPDALDETLGGAMLAEISDRTLPKGFGILHHKEGVDLLPGNIELSGIELSLINAMSRETVMRTVLHQYKDSYDYILIDCMPSLGLMTINSLAAADSVIVPSQPNYLSTKGFNLLLRSIGRIKRQINPRLKVGGVFLTMANVTNFRKDVIAAVRENCGRQMPVFRTVIPATVRLAEVSTADKSIFKHDPRGKAAEAYRSLVQEVSDIGTKQRQRSADIGR